MQQNDPRNDTSSKHKELEGEVELITRSVQVAPSTEKHKLRRSTRKRVRNSRLLDFVT